MPNKHSIVVNSRPLDEGIESLRGINSAFVKVGLLSGKSERYDYGSKEKINNPGLGAVHEFGSPENNIPERSFLRVPLIAHFPDKIRKIGTDWFLAIFQARGLKAALKTLGVMAENEVQEAFETHGYGDWEQWSPAYARERELAARSSGKYPKGFVGPLEFSLLIDSGQMRRAVTSEVVGAR
jgi:hypothetical protein